MDSRPPIKSVLGKGYKLCVDLEIL